MTFFPYNVSWQLTGSIKSSSIRVCDAEHFRDQNEYVCMEVTVFFVIKNGSGLM